MRPSMPKAYPLYPELVLVGIPKPRLFSLVYRHVRETHVYVTPVIYSQQRLGVSMRNT